MPVLSGALSNERSQGGAAGSRASGRRPGKKDQLSMVWLRRCEKGELVVRDPITRLAAFMDVQPVPQHSRLEEKSPHPSRISVMVHCIIT